MKIDTHLHTRNWSDGQDPIEELIASARARGLDGLVVTDHNTLLPRDAQQDLNARHPGFRVFRGAEVSVGREHVLVIGGEPINLRAYEPAEVAELRDAVARSGAFTALAHPWWHHNRQLEFDLAVFRPAAIDILSLNVDTTRLEESLALARTMGMHLIAGSDAHSREEVGLFHIVTDCPVVTDEELVRELGAGRYALGADPVLLARRFLEVREQEAIADRVLARGGSYEDFLREGGQHQAFYSRRKAGGSYFPRESLIGIRADGTQPAGGRGSETGT